MATYVLIHGGGGGAWDWHLVAAELRGRGHDVVAPDLPTEDGSAGLSQYADAVIDAIGDRTEIIVVAHSFGGFTAPLVCARMPVELLVLVAGMVPSPGEPPGSGGPIPVTRRRGWSRAGTTPSSPRTSMTSRRPWRRRRWPRSGIPPTRRCGTHGRSRHGRTCRRGISSVATTATSPPSGLASSYGTALGIVPDEIGGGHCPFLARPVELADRLEAYGAERRGGRGTVPDESEPVAKHDAD